MKRKQEAFGWKAESQKERDPLHPRCWGVEEFRRQAEIQKIRDEVLASMPGASAKLAKSGRAETESNAEPEIFTLKTKKLVQAQTRVLTHEGVCKRLLSDEVSSWEDVHVQLNNRSAADVKTLCGQLCEQALRTKAECISKIVDSLQGQDWMGWLERGVPFTHNPSCHKDVGWKDIRIPTQTWLVLCCICGGLGFVFGLAMDSCATYRLPSPVRRVVQYLQALKTKDGMNMPCQVFSRCKRACL